jgi:hypothetical protein
MVLDLLEAPESFYSYEVIASDGKTYPANRNIKHYQGIVKDEPNSLVAITFYENEITGLIATDEGNFNIAKDKRFNKHILYNDKNLKTTEVFECGTAVDNNVQYDSKMLLQPRNGATGNG